MHPKIRTQLPQCKYTWYWRDVAKELEDILRIDEDDEWFTDIQVRFRDWCFDFKVDELDLEDVWTFKQEESYSVNMWLYIYARFEDMDIENIAELINPDRETIGWWLADLENEYVDR